MNPGAALIQAGLAAKPVLPRARSPRAISPAQTPPPKTLAVAAPTSFSRLTAGVSLQHRQGRIAILSPLASPRTARLASQLNAYWPTRTLLRPAALLEALQSEMPLWQHDLSTQHALGHAIAQGASPVHTLLEYWVRHSARRSLTTACLFDMPMDDALSLLEPLEHWPGKRVLLRSSFAVHQPLLHPALDTSLTAPGAHEPVDEARGRLAVALSQPYAGFQPLWAATFTPRQRQALAQPAVARDLHTLAACRWVEWFGLGHPFGLLGIDTAGHPSWLQLSLATDAPAHAADAATAGLPATMVADAARGRSLCDLALQTALGTPQRVRCVPCFHLGDNKEVLAAWRPIPCDAALAQAMSLDEWRLNCGE